MAGSDDYRLPGTAIPRRYELELEPDLASASYAGQVGVYLDVVEATPELALNAVELGFQSAALTTPDGRELAGTITLSEAQQRAIISFGQTLEPAEGYRLNLSFSGVLNDKLHGFYRSTYTADDGSEQVIATTQFEPSDARRAFPCWDEPSFKATFAVTLVVAEGLTALSNAAVKSVEELAGGRQRVTFEDTMLMSTYLVAFVVGPYELTEPSDIDGVPLRVGAVPGRLPLTGYAVEVGGHALRFLSQYFDIPYPGDKIDHVAVPDFAFGAMENLGCVTYRENALLADPASASQLELQRIATVVSHETAHMWFGDLVTMKWWNGIWLNEAFATFMELTTTEAYNPEWQVWAAFGAGKSAAMLTDGLRATRPVEFSVRKPEEAEAMFDVLTYQKGGAVLRMLEQYLGAETFRKGITHYLIKHAYGNTETSDLWEAIEAISGEPVRSIMDSWIFQGGYPIVFVEAGADPSTITLRQQRFLYISTGGETGDASDVDAVDAADAATWSVPINFRASVGGAVQRQRILVDDRAANLTFDGPVDWLIVNDGSWGFYRVRYSSDLWARLRRADPTAVMDPLERLGLVTDTWATVVAGIADPSEFVSVAESLAGEVDPDVWTALGSVTGHLRVIAGHDDDPAAKDAVQDLVHRIADRSWQELTWEPKDSESGRPATARARVLASLGLIAEDETIRAEAVARFERFLADGSSLAPDLVAVAARISVSVRGATTWEKVLEEYRRTANPQDKLRYLFALTETDDPALLTKTLDLTISSEVRSQDGPFLIAACLARPKVAPASWQWLEANWSTINARFPPSLGARIFEGVANAVDPDLGAAVRAFCGSHDMPMTGPRLNQILERLEISIALAERLRGSLASALRP